MKKLFSLTLLMLGSLSAVLAQSGNSVLRLSLSDNSTVTISIDGTNYDTDGNGVATATDLDAGRHNVQVFRSLVRPGRKVPVLTTFTVRTNNEKATICTIDAGTGNVDMRLESNTPVDNNGRDDQYARNGNDRRDDRYNNQGSTRDRRDQDDDERSSDNRNDRNDNRRNDDNRDRNSDRDGRTGGRWRDDRNNDRYDRNDNRRDRDDRDNNDRDEADEQEPELILLTSLDITAIKSKVQKKSSDASKNTLMQTEVGDRGFTTEQARTMLRLMTNETYKMQFARWAVDGVTDIENFGKLNTEFKLAANKREIKKMATEAAPLEQ